MAAPSATPPPGPPVADPAPPAPDAPSLRRIRAERAFNMRLTEISSLKRKLAKREAAVAADPVAKHRRCAEAHLLLADLIPNLTADAARLLLDRVSTDTDLTVHGEYLGSIWNYPTRVSIDLVWTDASAYNTQHELCIQAYCVNNGRGLNFNISCTRNHYSKSEFEADESEPRPFPDLAISLGLEDDPHALALVEAIVYGLPHDLHPDRLDRLHTKYRCAVRPSSIETSCE